MAMLPVAMGAPPVEVEDAAVEEGETEPEAAVEVEVETDEVDAAVVWTATEPVEPEVVEAESVAAEGAEVAEAEAVVVASVRPSSPAEVAQALTLAGSWLYQAGIVPASISLLMEDSEAGSARSAYHDAGTAVARTVRMELGMLLRAAAALSASNSGLVM